MSKRGKSITEGATDAQIVSIRTGKSIAEGPLDKPDLNLNAEEQALLKVREEIEQAELKAKEQAQEEQRVATLQVKLDQALKQHNEKASLAFELLKAIMSQKTETVLAGTAFRLLVKGVFSLTDTFKDEIDSRWMTEVQTLSQTNLQSTSQSSETENKTVN